jgi:hypothetical protein
MAKFDVRPPAVRQGIQIAEWKKLIQKLANMKRKTLLLEKENSGNDFIQK